MADREKIIKGLECCILRNPDDHTRCSQCPYSGNCVNRLKIDALELLKDEPSEVLNVEKFSCYHGNCPACGKKIHYKNTNYCPYCGKRVKWE